MRWLGLLLRTDGAYGSDKNVMCGTSSVQNTLYILLLSVSQVRSYRTVFRQVGAARLEVDGKFDRLHCVVCFVRERACSRAKSLLPFAEQGSLLRSIVLERNV